MSTAPRHALLLALTLAAGCQTVREGYYNAWEKAGYAKRERLVDDVKAARDEQDEAKKQFVSALDQFKQLTGFKGGDLETAYNRLSGSYDDCQSQADAVKKRIDTVKNVGAALFSEWSGEIEQIKDDDSLQAQSKSLYDQTHKNYDGLVAKMDAAAASMDPVLTKFHNRVLFLKANLNAQAIGRLSGTTADLGRDIDKLVQQMQASISEADAFIAGMGKSAS